MILKSDLRSGPVDASDLKKDTLIQFQHRHYFFFATIFGVLLPAIIPGLLWQDWAGGFYFSSMLRLVVAHHVRVSSSVYSLMAANLDLTEHLLYQLCGALARIVSLR